ncbi:voltage-gated potassium channel [Aureococcus anophagefferens]|nr:voltage-gated potassium channel [Aureococcus anophagefferens]
MAKDSAPDASASAQRNSLSVPDAGRRRRTAGILESGRCECAELLEVSGGEDFVRVVGEEDNAPCCGVKIFDPDHPLIENFELLIMFILIFVFVTLPLCLAFERVERQLSRRTVCDLIFCVDVLKNCNTGYADDTGAIVMDRRRVLKLPADLVLHRLCFVGPRGPDHGPVAGDGERGDVVGGKKVLKLLRLVRMTKLVKLLRASQLVKQVRDTFVETIEYYKIHVSATLKLIRLFLTMLTLSHWGSCLMFILLKAYDYPASPGPALGHRRGGRVAVYGVLHCYWGIYKTLLLVLNCAYADFPSAQVCFETSGWCTIESWMTLVGVFLGWFLNLIFISTITSILVSMDVSTQEFEEQIQRTNDYMRGLRLPTELRDRIRDYYYQRAGAATVRAKTVLSCYAVGDEDLDEILEDHADMREYLAAVARKRAGRLARLHLSAARRRGRAALEDEEDARRPSSWRRREAEQGRRRRRVRGFDALRDDDDDGGAAAAVAPAATGPAADQARDGASGGQVTLPAIGEAASVRTLDDGVVQLE